MPVAVESTEGTLPTLLRPLSGLFRTRITLPKERAGTGSIYIVAIRFQDLRLQEFRAQDLSASS